VVRWVYGEMGQDLGIEETPGSRSLPRVSVAPTGVDPVTSRFSVVRLHCLAFDLPISTTATIGACHGY